MNREGFGGFIAATALLLASCATPGPERTVIKEVPTPYHQPCPKAEDKPPVPKRVAEETTIPKMPDGSPDYPAISRILGAKVLELFGYAEQADGVMTACSKPRGKLPTM